MEEGKKNLAGFFVDNRNFFFSFISKIIHQRDVKGCHQGIQERSTKDKAKQEKQKLETKDPW